MAGQRFQKFDYTMVNATPFSGAAPLEVSSVDCANARGISVAVSGPAANTITSGNLQAYGLVAMALLPNNTPDYSTARWVRLPTFDYTPPASNRDACAVVDFSTGLTVLRFAYVPNALLYSGGTALSLIYAVRKWGI